MAVNVNTVYTTVLYILNKEQRGYVTPAEFNSLATQVQDEIFNSYFPDGNQLNRVNQNNTQNNTEFFNMFDDVSYKISPFIKQVDFSLTGSADSFLYPVADPVTTLINPSLYRIGQVISTYSGQPQCNSITQLVTVADYNKIERSKLTKPTKKYPIYYLAQGSSFSPYLYISPLPDSVKATIIAKPSSPQWSFTTGNLNQYVYNGSLSSDFELDISEQSLIIMKILKYCGVIINDPTVIQVAEQESQQTEVNEKS